MSLLDTLVGHKEREQALPVIEPLYRHEEAGRPVEIASASDIRFGPGDSSAASDGPPADEAVARKPPPVRVPVDKSLLPSVRLGQKKDNVPSKLTPLTGAPTAVPETRDTAIPPRDSRTGPEREGFFWIDKDDVQSTSNKNESKDATESENEQDLQVEELDDETPSVDPRKSVEITEWTDSWAQVTGGNTPGKYKRPIRRFAPKGARSRSVQWADGKSTEAETAPENQSAKPISQYKSQTRSPVVEKKAPAAAPLKSMGDKGKSRPIQATIVERKPSMPAPLNRKGMAGVFPADRGAEAAPVVEKKAEKPAESPTGDIEGMLLLAYYQCSIVNVIASRI